MSKDHEAPLHDASRDQEPRDGACRAVRARLDDLVDERLAAADRREVEEHLAACPECRREAAALRRLLTAAGELPRGIEPPRDLWPGIAERLDERAAPVRTSRPDLWRAPWWQQVAAAVVFTLLGAGVASWLGDAASDTGPPVPTATLEAPVGEVAVAAADPFVLAEVEYLRARESLWLAATSRGSELPPERLEVVARNLTVIDDALRQIRAAIERHPDDRRLYQLALAKHRQGLDLLWDLVRA